MSDDHGFTLIELIVATSILGMVMAAAVAVLIVSVRTTTATQSRLSESHDAQITAAYFVNDVQGAEQVTACGASAASFSSQSRTIVYAATGGALHRQNTPAAGAADDVVVVHNLAAFSCVTAGAAVTLHITAGTFTFDVTGDRRVAVAP
jgi:prepilin-type N-terminal cleavage/methylation domain-containing protein